LTSIAAGELIDEDELPMRFMAYTACFRREAGSAGKDTRGLLRGHEFDKVEILAYATPEQAPALLIELRYRPVGKKGTEVLHTLNGSALAVPRVWAALIEHGRQPDGSIALPEALWP